MVVLVTGVSGKYAVTEALVVKQVVVVAAEAMGNYVCSTGSACDGCEGSGL